MSRDWNREIRGAVLISQPSPVAEPSKVAMTCPGKAGVLEIHRVQQYHLQNRKGAYALDNRLQMSRPVGQ